MAFAGYADDLPTRPSVITSGLPVIVTIANVLGISTSPGCRRIGQYEGAPIWAERIHRARAVLARVGKF